MITKVETNIHPYLISHGKEPRGFGYWAFCPQADYRRPDYIDRSFFISGTYAQAKASAVAHFSKLGVSCIVTLP